MTYTYDWKIKEKPEDFIVNEIAYHKLTERGNHYLYQLIKRNFDTAAVAGKFNLSYAGLKDKRALTFQYVSSENFLGDVVSHREKESFFILRFLGKTDKKIKIGNLEANRFNIRIKPSQEQIKPVDFFINYFDTQRVKPSNIEKGKKLLLESRKLSNLEEFFIDSYLSFLWNISLEEYLKANTEGIYLEDKGLKIFVPEKLKIVPNYWPILGYKVKLDESIPFYEKVLAEEGFSLESILKILKKRRIKGSYRRGLERVFDFSVSGGYINFTLKKGAYATMLLKFLYAKNLILNSKNCIF